MSRFGIVNGVKREFTHRNPQTGEYWCEDTGGWYPSKSINFDNKPKESRFKRR